MTSHAHRRFNIVELWDKLNDVVKESIPNDSRLTFASGFASFTREECHNQAGPGVLGMSTYEGSQIWTRATTWKFPLFQVFALFPRPPLNLKTEFFVIIHLLGDPIDSVQSLLAKISRCQKRAAKWKLYLDVANIPIDADSDEDTDTVAHRRDEKQVQQCRWKSLTLVTDAYEEWGQADDQFEMMLWVLYDMRIIRNVLTRLRSLFDYTNDRSALLKTINLTSDALAADRATKYLPAIVAIVLFIAIIAIAMIRTTSAIGTPIFNKSLFISVEVHSITFSSLYFWIIPALLFASFIGVSQTEASLPRILDRHHEDLYKHFSQHSRGNLWEILQLIEKLIAITKLGTVHRMLHGGIYSWQPSLRENGLPWPSTITGSQQDATTPLVQRKVNTSSKKPDQSHPSAATSSDNAQPTRQGAHKSTSWSHDLSRQTNRHLPAVQSTLLARIQALISAFWQWVKPRFLPILIILIPTITGAITSSRVPPDGWNCRVTGETAVFFAWLVSAELNYVLQSAIPLGNTNSKKIFWWTLAKDTIIALGTIVWVFMTVVGALNRCDCWIDHDGSLILPQREDIDKILRHRLNRDYPAWIFSGVAVELVLIPWGVQLWYSDGLKVFVQRDDGTSNFPWSRRTWQWIKRKCRRTKKRIDSGLSMVSREDPRSTS